MICHMFKRGRMQRMYFVDCEDQKVLKFHRGYVIAPGQMVSGDNHMMSSGFNTRHFVWRDIKTSRLTRTHTRIDHLLAGRHLLQRQTVFIILFFHSVFIGKAGKFPVCCLIVGF